MSARSNLCEFPLCGKAMEKPCDLCRKRLCPEHLAGHNCEAEQEMERKEAGSASKALILDASNVVLIRIGPMIERPEGPHGAVMLLIRTDVREIAGIIDAALNAAGIRHIANIPADEVG